MNTEEGKLLEETKPWKIACDLCLHKERTFIPKISDKNLMCDFHKKIHKDMMIPPKNNTKLQNKPNKVPLKKNIAVKNINKKLKFMKLEDILFFNTSNKNSITDLTDMQNKNNEILKDLSDM